MAKGRILIVEDDALVAQSLEIKLTSLGYDVCAQARSGPDAITFNQQHHPDLILMDIVLEGDMDGIEATEIITQASHTPVLYLTAFDDEAFLARAQITQPYGYLLKPCSERDLDATLTIALYRADMQRQREAVYQLEKQLLKQTRYAALATLTSSVTEQINTPLNSSVLLVSTIRDLLNQYAPLRLETSTKNDLYECLNLLESNIQRAAALVHDFKGVALDQTHKPKRTIYLKDYLQCLVDLNGSALKHSQYRVDIVCPEGLSHSTHPDLLAMILTHLLRNSLIHGFKNTRQGHISICVQDNTDTITLAYQDNGCGMTPDQCAHYFQPRCESNRTPHCAGLGGPLIYQITTQFLGGKIQLHSHNGEGITISMQLPQLEAPSLNTA